MIYVMSDIHGNLRRFYSVMEQINLQPEDTLYVLGDVVDYHEHGVEILQAIMQMANVTMLLGNHEFYMLNAIAPLDMKLPWNRTGHEHAMDMWMINGGMATYEKYLILSELEKNKIITYLASLPINVDISVSGIGFKLVHAAPLELFKGHYGRDYQDEVEFALCNRFHDFSYIPENYIMVFGHTPTSAYKRGYYLSVFHGEGVIGIDCGSAMPDKSDDEYHQGRLACLCLNDMKEYYSVENSRE